MDPVIFRTSKEDIPSDFFFLAADLGDLGSSRIHAELFQVSLIIDVHADTLRNHI